MIKTSEAIRMARALIGTPYSELDCINLIKKVIRTAPGGDKNYTTAGTNDLWNSDSKSAKYRDLTWKQEGISGAKAGMLAFMGVGTGDVNHTGLVTERGTVIHSSKSRGGVVETALTEKNGWNGLGKHRMIAVDGEETADSAGGRERHRLRTGRPSDAEKAERALYADDPGRRTARRAGGKRRLAAGGISRLYGLDQRGILLQGWGGLKNPRFHAWAHSRARMRFPARRRIRGRIGEDWKCSVGSACPTTHEMIIQRGEFGRKEAPCAKMRETVKRVEKNFQKEHFHD